MIYLIDNKLELHNADDVHFLFVALSTYNKYLAHYNKVDCIRDVGGYELVNGLIQLYRKICVSDLNRELEGELEERKDV